MSEPIKKEQFQGRLKYFTPGQVKELSKLNRKLNKEKADQLLKGFIPTCMEDRWILYYDPEEGNIIEDA